MNYAGHGKGENVKTQIGRFAARLLMLVFVLACGLSAQTDLFARVLPCAVAEEEESLNERDGSKIESVEIHWISPESTRDNEGNPVPEEELRTDLMTGTVDKDPHLYIATKSDDPLEMRYQLEVSLSGQYNYAPGDIQIIIPAQVWSNRDGKLIGDLDLSVPAYPSTKADFNWQLINGNYVLTNTRTIGATDKSMFQFSIYNLIPHTIVDMSECTIQARCEVVTNKGNLIALDSNVIAAQIDTYETITSTYKEGKLYEASDNVPKKLLANLPGESPNPDDYIYVNWRSWVYYTGNQPFSLKVADYLDEAYQVVWQDGEKTRQKVADGIFLGCTNYDGVPVGDEIDFEASIVKDIYNKGNGEAKYPVYFWSAYEKSKFYVPGPSERQVLYEMLNDVEWTLTETDPEVEDPGYGKPKDEQKITSKPAHAQVQYAPIKWQRPVGVFGVSKWTEYVNYKDYTYGYALNRLQSGEAIDINFLVDTYAEGYAYTLDRAYIGATDAVLDALNEEDYGRTGWTQVTEDNDTYFNFSSTPLTARDFEFKSMRITTPTKWRWAKQSNGQWGYRSDNSLPTPDLIIEYQLNGDGVWHRAAVAVWGEDGTGALHFEDVATADGVSVSGSVISFPQNTTDVRHTYTSNVFNGKRPERCELAQIRWRVYPTITFKPSDAVQGIVVDLFAASDAPSTKFKNDVDMDFYGYVTENEALHLGSGFDSSLATLAGASYGVSIIKTVDFDPRSVDNHGDNDVENQRAILHYSAVVSEQSNLKDRLFYDEAVADNVIPAETKCVWYDLLPEGVTPMMDSIRLRKDDTITAKYTIPNFRDSNRILLVVEAELTPQPIGTVVGFVDKPSITFDAVYTWNDIEEFGTHLKNYIAFESKTENLRNDTLGTVSGSKGEPDDPSLQENYSTPSRSEFWDDGLDVAKVLKDLDPTTDARRFLYSKAENTLNINIAALSGVAKKVSSDLDGVWSQGLDDQEQVTVYEGHSYTYRLRVVSSPNTNTRDIVLYDTIENYDIPDPNSDETHDATKAKDYLDRESKKSWQGDWLNRGQWRGTLKRVDLSDLTGNDVAPRLFYSTIPYLGFADSTPDMTHEEKLELFSKEAYDLTNTTYWTEVDLKGASQWNVPDGLLVTAVAIDARKTTSGEDFVLKAGENITAYLHMRAPDDGGKPNEWHAKGAYAHKTDPAGNPLQEIDWKAATDPANNMYAFNNTRLKCVQENMDGGGESSDVMIRNDYTRVGLLPGVVSVKKVWNDNNNHDGLRPESVTVTLLRKKAGSGLEPQPVLDGAGQKMTATLSAQNDWTALFTQVDIVDENGVQYLYSFAEAEVPEYTSETQMIDASHYQLVNTHPNAKVRVSGLKTWDDNDNALGLRPETVTLHLYRDGERIKSTTIRVSRTGDVWRYNFGDLDKYADGGREYVYTVEEEYVPKYVMESTHWDALTNRYCPYGDLEISKTLVDATQKAAENEFTFTLMLNAEAEEGDDPNAPPTPLEGEFDYDILQLAPDGETWEVLSSGKIATRGTFTLKNGQKLVVHELPSESTYEVSENAKPGFTLISHEGSEGSILAGRTQTAAFVNRYAARQPLQLTAQKTLTGRKLRKNQFRFTLTDITDGEPGQVIRMAVSNIPSQTTGGNGEPIVSVATADFGQITYTQADDGKTYLYRVTEDNEGDAGYTYSTEQYVVAVTLKDNGDGTMTMTAVRQDTGASVLTGDGSALPFHNQYKAKGEVSFKVWKVLQARDLANGEFTFELYQYNQETGERTLLSTAQNDADGNVVFAALSFDQDDVSLDADHPAKYSYLVREQRGADETVVYSNLEYIFTVTVYDNNDGTLSFAQENQVGEREYIPCKRCDGTGQVPAKEIIARRYWSKDWQKLYTTYFKDTLGNSICEKCQGFAYIDGVMCDKCQGSGLPLGGYHLTSAFLGNHYDYIKYVYKGGEERAYVVGYCTRRDYTFYYQTIITEKCDNCDGSGLVEGGMKITGAATVPVFTNKLKDGALNVTKLVNDNPYPGQAFTFHVQFAGESVPKELDYTITQVVTNKAAAATLLRETKKEAESVYYYLPEEEKAKTPFAVLDPATGDMVIFRELVDQDGNFTYNGASLNTRAFSGNRYQDTENNLIYFNLANNEASTSPSWPWSGDKSKIKNITMTGGFKPRTCWWMLSSASNLVTADFSMLDTSAVGTFAEAFKSCGRMTYINVSGWDVSNAYSFERLFCWCYALEELDTSNWVTTGATNFKWMFCACHSLTELDCGKMTSENVYNFYQMFCCDNLKTLNVAQFDTSGASQTEINTMEEMFDCPKLSTITIGDKTVHLSGGSLPNPPDDDGVHTGKWFNVDTGELIDTSKELLAGNHAGTWTWEAYSYKVNFDANGGGGSMQSLNCQMNRPLTFKSAFYRFGYKLTGFTDGAGNHYDADGNGAVTIPADTYGKDEEVTLTAVWEKIDTHVVVENNTLTFTLFGNEMASFTGLPAGLSYKVWEDTPAGWVLVEQSGVSGVIQPLQISSAVFTNEYTPDRTSAYLSALKTLDGKAPAAGTYTFTLTEEGTELQTQQNGEGGAVIFDPIFYTGDDVGVHEYVIAEVAGDAAEVAYDTAVYTATVTVSDDGKGVLSATVAYAAQDGEKLSAPPTFRNVTKPGSLTLRKALAGDPIAAAADQPFDFVVTFTDEKHQLWTGSPRLNGVPQTLENGSLTVSVSANSPVTLTDISAGISYAVREEGTLPGWTLDGTVVTGQINANKGSVAQLTNTYAAVGQAMPQITKELIGRPLKDGEFTFVLRESSGEGNVVSTATNGEDGVVRFDELTFTKAGTYNYTVSEEPGDDATVDYSGGTIDIAIVMTDEKGIGTLTPTITYTKDGKQTNAIVNRVKPGRLQVSKSVEGKETDARFDFTLLITAGGKPLSGTYPTLLGDNAGELVVTNGKASFTLAHGETLIIDGLPDGAGYSLAEDKLPGYDADAHGASGTIVAGETKAASFVNRYHAAGSYTLSAVKTLEGAQLQADQFTFELKDSDGFVVQTVSNAADGSISFEPLTFDESDIGKQRYTLSEVNTSIAGFTYDKTVYVITLDVADHGDGTLDITPKLQQVVGDETGDVEEAAFGNSYSTFVSISATKEWIGDEEHKEGRCPITLTLYKQVAGGQRVPVSSKEIPADASGDALTVTWDNMPLYEESPDGQQVEVFYSVEEKMEVPDGGSNPYTTVVMGDVGSGFRVINRFSTVTARPEVKKELVGGTLQADKFAFILKDETGTEVARARNLGQEDGGKVLFEPLAFTPDALKDVPWDADQGIRQKTLRYTIEELPGDFFGYIYDDSVYQFDVTLTQNRDGELTVETVLSLDGAEVDEAAFENTRRTTSFHVTKEWVGGNGGAIELTLYANGKKLSPQPAYTRKDDTYSYSDLPMYDEDERFIVYTAKERFMDGFMTIYNNVSPYKDETDVIYDGGTIINRAVASVHIQKVWTGLASGQKPPEIELELYCNGQLMDHKTPKPDANGWYHYNNLPLTYNGEKAVYTVKEKPMDGFYTEYSPVDGEDRGYVMNGGVITNRKIPQTGDSGQPALWLALAACAFLSGMTIMRRRTQKQ